MLWWCVVNRGTHWHSLATCTVDKQLINLPGHYLKVKKPSTCMPRAWYTNHFKVLTHGSHSFTCNKHHACLLPKCWQTVNCLPGDRLKQLDVFLTANCQLVCLRQKIALWHWPLISKCVVHLCPNSAEVKNLVKHCKQSVGYCVQTFSIQSRTHRQPQNRMPSVNNCWQRH